MLSDSILSERDDAWLISRMMTVWDSWFSDVERKNKVIVRWKGRWKNKFGHIRMRNGVTEIAVNGLFKSNEVPEEIVDMTIAHEICHYCHGFQSPLEKKYSHPHKFGVVRKELISRGLKNSLKREREFMKKWYNIYRQLAPEKISRTKSVFRTPMIKVRHFSSFFGI